MEISRINNTNFKGLWTSKNKQTGMVDEENPRDRGFHDTIPFTYEEAIYHPFADETDDEINQVIIDASRDSFMGVFPQTYFNPTHPLAYKIIQPKVGSRLGMTEKEYDELDFGKEARRDVGDLRETPHSMDKLGDRQYYKTIPMSSRDASDFMQFGVRFDNQEDN